VGRVGTYNLFSNDVKSSVYEKAQMVNFLHAVILENSTFYRMLLVSRYISPFLHLGSYS
jgi:hypothetical protein